MDDLRSVVYDLYKQANDWKIPVQLIRSNRDGVFSNMSNEIEDMKSEDLATILSDMTTLYPHSSELDRIMVAKEVGYGISDINSTLGKNNQLTPRMLEESYSRWDIELGKTLKHHIAIHDEMVCRLGMLVEETTPAPSTEPELEDREIELQLNYTVTDVVEFLNDLELTKYVPYARYNDLGMERKVRTYTRLFTGVFVITGSSLNMSPISTVGGSFGATDRTASSTLGFSIPIGAAMNSNIILQDGKEGEVPVGISLEVARETAKSTFQEINDIQSRDMYDAIREAKIMSTMVDLNVFYFVIYTGDEMNPSSWNYRGNLSIGKLNVKTGKMKIEIRSVNKDVVVSRIKEVLSIEYTKSTRYGGIMYFPKMSFDYYTILELVMNDPLFDKSLFFNESEDPLPRRKVRYINFKTGNEDVVGTEVDERNPSSVYCQLFNRRGMYGRTDVEDLDFSEDFIEVNIVKIVSMVALRKFLALFRRFMQDYKNRREELIAAQIEISSGYLDNDDFLPEYRESVRMRGREQDRRNLARDLFINGYNAICPNPPLPLMMHELEDLEGLGKLKDRERIQFRLNNNEEVTLMCQGDDPHIVMYKNLLPNSSRYPVIPCCSNKKSHPDEVRIVDLNIRKIGGKRVLEEDQRSSTRKEITDIFQLAKLRAPEVIGTEKGPRTFLSMIAKAISHDIDNPYTADYVYSQLLRGGYHVEVAAQEIYGMENKFNIGDPTLYYDPRLYYRIFEELFDIEIMGFTLIDGKIVPDIPRYSPPVHIRRRRKDRRMAVYYRHWGSRVDNLENPQVELVVSGGLSTFGGTKTLASEMWKFYRLYNESFLIAHNNPMNMLKDEDGYPLLPDRDGRVKNVWREIFDQVDYSELGAEAQILDGGGKLRGIHIRKNGKIYEVYMPPSQPLNLPAATSRKLRRYSTIVDEFGEPQAVSRGENGKIQGLWYPSNEFVEWFFIRSLPHRGKGAKLRVLPSPVDVHSRLSIGRQRRLKKLTFLVIKIILWLYLTFRGERSAGIKEAKTKVKSFINRYFYVGDRIEYEIDTPRELPHVEGVEDALNYVEGWSTNNGLVTDRGIRMYSDKFSAGIAYFLETFESNYSYFDFPIPTSLTDISTEDVRLFLDDISVPISSYSSEELVAVKIIIWLYVVSGMDSAREFLKRYSVVSNGVYVLNAPLSFPVVSDIGEAIEAACEWNIISESKGLILLHSEEFSRLVKHSIRNYKGGLPSSLEDIGEEVDIIASYKVVVKSFSSTQEMDDWIDFSNGDKIVVKLDNTLANEIDPYFYRGVGKSNDMYIIQNVLAGDIDKAVSLSRNWLETGVNLGFYHVGSLDERQTDIVQYGIDENGDMGVLAVPGEGNMWPEVLHYRDGRYAAVLRL